MEVYPSYMELRELGFINSKVIQITSEDPAEQELFSLLKKIDNSIDSYFTRNEQLTLSGREMLDKISAFLNKYPEVKMEISVHTDNRGYPSTNLSTSQLRAKTLMDYLISKGIDKGRLIAWGYGGSKPIALNIDEKGRKKNRRVEFNILQY
jgi:outer membrane protein OmpA-like peptidoglycan-associated protein